LLCEHFEAHGVTMDGGFAEYCAYPAGRVFKIQNLSWVDATLLEPASCAAHGLDKIAPKMGSSVLMLGAAAATSRFLGNQAGGQQNGDDQGDGGGAGMLGKVADVGKSAAISAFGRSGDRIGERLSEIAMTMRGGEASEKDERAGDEKAGTNDDGNGAKQPQASTDETDEPHAGNEVGEAQDDVEGAKAA